MIRRSTVVYIVILVALVGAYFYLKNRNQAEEADVLATVEPSEEVSYLFTEDNGIPTRIRIEAKTGEIVEVARDAENAWMLTLPLEAKAEQGSSEAAASQVTTMRVLDTIPEIDLEVVGLKDPVYTITIEFTGGKERTINIGVITPSENGYYVQDVSNKEVVIVSKSAVDALLGLLTSPPYLETPTPSPLPATETPVPTPTEAGTPASATATP
jgi:hypothetical protein